jgi:hypothetical protein
VLEALAAGREKVLAVRRRRFKLVRELVAYEIKLDAAAGNSERGRAARIAERLRRATVPTAQGDCSRVTRALVYRAYKSLVSVEQTETRNVGRSAA